MDSKPESIVSFDSLTEFLKRHYEARRAESPRFSFGSWSARLKGLNRSQLRQIVEGQRTLPESRIPDFVDYFGLRDAEAEHFVDLAGLARAGSSGERERLTTRIHARRRDLDESKVIERRDGFLSDHRLPVLATLLTFKDLEKTPSRLAELLGQPVDRVNEWLSILERLGWAEKTPAGAWNATHPAFRVSEERGAEDLIRYHASALDQARDGLALDPRVRNFENLLMPLSAAEYERLLKLLVDFRREVLSQFDADDLTGRALYQLNLSLVPVTDRFKGES